MPEFSDRAASVVDALVSNAVEHGRSSCRVSVSLDDRGLHIGVRDYGPSGPPRVRPVDLTAERGRGLHLVVLLSGRWGVTGHADGKTVWASLTRLEPAPGSAVVVDGLGEGAVAVEDRRQTRHLQDPTDR